MDVSRYIDTTELKFEVEFITPTFLGGADGNAELRTAPFKHGLRYWWRVLYSFKYGNKIRETEDLIFGSTEQSSTVHISFLGIIQTDRIEKKGFPNGEWISVLHQGRKMSVNILDYLAYGKYEYVKGKGNEYTSTYIKPGTKVTMCLRIKDTGHTEEIKDALKMFILYGGVGSRSRNGFGSMWSDTLNIDFSKKITLSELKEYPVLSEKALFYRTKIRDTWEAALSEVGIVYKNARCSLEKQHQYEKRGLISRPIEVKGEKSIPHNVRNDRIPKPFYLGVRRYDDKFLGYILCLPILFYEKQNQADYLKQVKKMETYFSENLKDDTKGFLAQFIGGTK